MAESATVGKLHSSLLDELETALPEGTLLNINHISTPPTKCAAIYSAPEGSKPQKTYCESHFLTASINIGKTGLQDQSASTILVFAIEVLIYSTATLTTLFVSKADSTGYLHLSELPRGTASPIQTISTTFLSFLTQHRRRQGVPLVVTLFARAQDQYLFPGSIENSGKHVLDDRGLIRWWCKVLDPVLRVWPGKEEKKDWPEKTGRGIPTSQGYLIVPGYDKYETQSVFPVSSRADAPDQKRWHSGHPLDKISRYFTAPPHCLIPHFPDDPKARFLDELDEEILETSERHTTQRTGQWKSIKSMDQFWETMQFRQECSSGRLVGFIWMVLMPNGRDLRQKNSQDCFPWSSKSQNTQLAEASLLPTPENSQIQMPVHWSTQVQTSKYFHELELQSPNSSPVHSPSTSQEILPKNSDSKRSRYEKSKRLTGPIHTRQPRFRSVLQTKSFDSIPEQSRFYTWPSEGRGSIVLGEKDYKRVNNLLLKLDFATLDIAQQSTRKWIKEIRLISGSSQRIETLVRGRYQPAAATTENQRPPTMLMGRKRKNQASDLSLPKSDDKEDDVNTLSAGLVRKKGKTEVPPADGNDHIASSEVNVLGSGLVRKKART